MASWNSFPLKITYEVFGWLAFVSWSISFYPQAILNFRRKRQIFLHTLFSYCYFVILKSYFLLVLLLQCGGFELRFRGAEFDEALLLLDLQRFALLQLCNPEAVL